MFKDDDILDELLESKFIPIPEKSKAIQRGNYRTISIMSHITKALLRVLLNQAYIKKSANVNTDLCQTKEREMPCSYLKI